MVDHLENLDADVNHFNQLYPSLDNESSDLIHYFTSDTFNENYSESSSDLTLIHTNIQSFFGEDHHDQFCTLMGSLNVSFDILCFSETWLKENTKDLISFPNYRPFHLTRERCRGGGVSVFVSDRCNSSIALNGCRCNANIEALFVDIKYCNKNITVGVVYKSPLADNTLFLSELEQLITTLNVNKDQFVVCGDFNLDLLNYLNHNPTLQFLNSMSASYLKPLISKPTRITDNSATLIDNIFLSNANDCSAGILLSDISDHYPIFSVIKKYFAPSPLKQTVVKYRLINDVTLNNLYSKLQSFNFDEIVSCNDCDRAISLLTEVIYDMFNDCCPIRVKTVSPKNVTKPWIKGEILCNIKKRQNYLLLYRQGKLSKYVCSRFRNFVTSQIRSAKVNYYCCIFEEYKSNMRKTWRVINNVIRPDSNTNRNTIKKIICDNIVYDDPLSISETFNNYFSTIGSNISNSVNCNENDHLQFLTNINYPNSFFFSPVLPIDIENIIRSLKNKSSPINTFSTKILKYITMIISPVLANIINRCLSTGHFPESLKLARVIPIYKAGDKLSINNYRPISLLPLFSKIYEKVVRRQLFNFLTKFNILHPDQYGFQPNKSTSHAIIDYLQQLYSNIDSGDPVFSIFLDFRKAFDCVDHTILLSKLQYYGIRGLAHNWFASYLQSRKQYVSINGVDSSVTNISHGVPQGSVLGPLLFLLFINDLPKVSNKFQTVLFADDSTLSIPMSKKQSLEDHASVINIELARVQNWIKCNKMCINPDKTRYIVFSYRNNVELPIVELGDNVIQATDSIKFLGVIIDEKLSFQYHVNYISTKLSKSVGILYKLVSFLPPSILRKLYFTLDQPYLCYGIEAWFGTTKNQTDKIFISQKKSIRAMNGLPFNAHTNQFFKDNNILKLDDLYHLNISKYMYKNVVHAPSNQLPNSFNLNSDIHDHFTRNQNNLNIVRCNREKSKASMSFVGPKVWNSVPVQIKNKPFRSFVHSLKKHLISLY
jgi:hypothetical protein